MTEPSQFLPQVWDLSASPVQAVQTAGTDPRVRMDKTGLWSTDATGAKVFNLDAAHGSGFFKGGVQLPLTHRQVGVQRRFDVAVPDPGSYEWEDPNTGKVRTLLATEVWDNGATFPVGVARMVAIAGIDVNGNPIAEKCILDENGGSDFLEANNIGAWHASGGEAVSANAGAWALNFDTTDTDPLAMKTSSSTFTVPKTGLYLLHAYTYVQSSPGAYMLRWVRASDSKELGVGHTWGSTYWQCSCTGLAYLAANDQLHLWMTTGNATYNVNAGKHAEIAYLGHP